MSSFDILIVEDNPILREMYKKQFMRSGFTVRTATNGNEVDAIIHERVPDLLLLDIKMPKCNGFEVLEKYPRAERSFPIVMMTNYPNGRNCNQCRQLGADACFFKDRMTIGVLMGMVSHFLKKRQRVMEEDV